jgi:spore coat protein U-like protein
MYHDVRSSECQIVKRSTFPPIRKLCFGSHGYLHTKVSVTTNIYAYPLQTYTCALLFSVKYKLCQQNYNTNIVPNYIKYHLFAARIIIVNSNNLVQINYTENL